jgi:hypothetical protein
MIRELVAAMVVSGSILIAAQEPVAEPPAQAPANFVEGYIDIEAIGAPPLNLPTGSSAAYADARRAAYLLASRELAERLAGMYMESTTSFSDSGAQDFVDKLKATLTKVHVPGGQTLKESSFEAFQQDNKVRLVVRFQLSTALPMLMNQLAPHLITVEGALPKAEPEAPATEGHAYDALVVKVPGGFEPSIAPKMYNGQGQLVYGSASVAAVALKAQGIAAQFTTTEERAKASLEAHGAKHPLVISGYLHTGNKDVDLEEPVARQVLEENARGHFLERGRVYIVIGGK